MKVIIEPTNIKSYKFNFVKILDNDQEVDSYTVHIKDFHRFKESLMEQHKNVEIVFRIENVDCNDRN